MSNGLQNGLDRGLAAGTFEGTRRGELSGVVGNEPVSIDVDAMRFFLAAGIRNPVHSRALNALVISLKKAGIWNKMKAIYPFVGGTESSHRWNLKDPRDSNAAFRLQFFGGWTHSENGATPNGTTGYADTNLAPSLHQSITSGHFSLYSRTAIASTSQFGCQGVYNSANSDCSYFILRRSLDNSRGGSMWNENPGGSAVELSTTPDGKGYYLLSRIANNDVSFYRNGGLLNRNSIPQTSPVLISSNYYLGALNILGAPFSTFADNKELAFATIGSGLTVSEVNQLNILVQKFQTILGRQV
jgi:hypothetical protein